MSIKNYISLFTAILETIIAGGMIDGWSSLNYVLTIEGYFNSSCHKPSKLLNQTSSKSFCASQQYNLQLVLTLGMTVSLLFLAITVVTMDKLGTWIIRTICSLIFTLSCLVIAFSTPNTSWVLYPSAILLSAGGLGLFVANCQSANLFPKFRGLIINIINACTEASIAMFTIVKIVYEQYDVSLKAAFVFLAILGLLFFARTFFLTARTMIPYNVPPGYYYGIKECCTKYSKTNEHNETIQLINKDISVGDNINKTNEEETTRINQNEENVAEDLKSCIFHSIYILGVFSLSVQMLRLNFFVEELNSWLYYIVDGNLFTYSSYLNAFGFIQFGALLMAPISGLFFDFLLIYFSKSNSRHHAKLKAQAAVCFLASTTTITYSLCTLIPVPELQYVTFVLFVWADIMFWSNVILLVLNFFPMRYLGTLLGVAVLISGVFSLFQYLLLYVAIHFFKSNFFVVNLIVFILAVMSLAHPINLFRLSQK